MFEVRGNPLAQHNVEVLYPHVHIEAALASRHLAHVVARILYGQRTTADRPIYVEYGYDDFDPHQHNAVYFVQVTDMAGVKRPGEGWRELSLGSFLAKYAINAKAYINDTAKSAAMFWSGRSDPRYLLATLPRLTPWRFKEIPATEWEKRFVFSLLGNDDKDFCRMMAEYLSRENIEGRLQGAQLDDFLSHLLDRKTKALMDRSEEINRFIREHEDQIRSLMAEQTELSVQILGARAGHDADAIEDFRVAFMGNPHCHLLEAAKSHLVFGVTGFVDNFNEALYLNVSKEHRSVLYREHQTYTPQVMHAAYDELFLGNRYRIQMYGAVSLDLQTNTVMLLSTRGDTWQKDAIPNPHMVHYHCQGGFGALYNEALRAGRYADVIDIALSEVRNINWADTTVVSHFAGDLVGFADYACIWDKQDKVFITPNELWKRKAMELNG